MPRRHQRTSQRRNHNVHRHFDRKRRTEHRTGAIAGKVISQERQRHGRQAGADQRDHLRQEQVPEVAVAQDLDQQIPPATSIVAWLMRSEEHTSELQSLMRISYAVFCLKKKKQPIYNIMPITPAVQYTYKKP